MVGEKKRKNTESNAVFEGLSTGPVSCENEDPPGSPTFYDTGAVVGSVGCILMVVGLHPFMWVTALNCRLFPINAFRLYPFTVIFIIIIIFRLH